MYDMIGGKVTYTPSGLSTEASLMDVDIVVGDHSKWLVLLVPVEKRI